MNILFNTEKLTLEVCDLARETRKFLSDEIDKLSQENIRLKGKHDFVTYVDKKKVSRKVFLQPVYPITTIQNQSLTASFLNF